MGVGGSLMSRNGRIAGVSIKFWLSTARIVAHKCLQGMPLGSKYGHEHEACSRPARIRILTL